MLVCDMKWYQCFDHKRRLFAFNIPKTVSDKEIDHDINRFLFPTT